MNTQRITLIRRNYEEEESFKKGRDFERFVIKLFNQQHFHVKAFQESRKITNGRFRSDFSDPDLLIVFGKYRKYEFAVECKWRRQFHDGGKIHWAKRRQINSYLNFQIRNHTTVYIAIGIGGEPSNPASLFLTPLDRIHRFCHVYASELIPYKRKPTRRFFFDTTQLKLF